VANQAEERPLACCLLLACLLPRGRRNEARASASLEKNALACLAAESAASFVGGPASSNHGAAPSRNQVEQRSIQTAPTRPSIDLVAKLRGQIKGEWRHGFRPQTASRQGRARSAGNTVKMPPARRSSHALDRSVWWVWERGAAADDGGEGQPRACTHNCIHSQPAVCVLTAQSE
jgi:hypothetical protein